MGQQQVGQDQVLLSEDGHADPDAPPQPRPEASALKATSAWRMAECLKALLNQVNALAPNRDRASDGGLGDAAMRAGRAITIPGSGTERPGS